MQLVNFFRGLGRNDIKQVQRDSLLRWLIIYPLIIALLLRFAVPALTDALADTFDLSAYYVLLVGYICLTAPMLTGTVVGFLLLDERDENTLQAQLVTPIPLPTYVSYRVATPALIGIVQSIIVVPLLGLVEVPLLALVGVGLVGGLFAPIVALFFASFAENKVQGFALMKIIGALGLLAVVAYFVPMPWQDLAVLVLPPFWTVKALWIAAGDSSGSYALYLLGSLLVQVGVLALLVRRFQHMAHRA